MIWRHWYEDNPWIIMIWRQSYMLQTPDHVYLTKIDILIIRDPDHEFTEDSFDQEIIIHAFHFCHHLRLAMIKNILWSLEIRIGGVFFPMYRMTMKVSVKGPRHGKWVGKFRTRRRLTAIRSGQKTNTQGVGLPDGHLWWRFIDAWDDSPPVCQPWCWNIY